MSDFGSSARHSGGGSEIDEEEKPAYIPKNPIILPHEVKLSKIMQDLIGKDKRQEHLHRILASAADKDNQFTVAAHMQKVFKVLIESYPNNALEKLEEVSYLIKHGNDLSAFLKTSQDCDYKAQARDLAAFIEKAQPLFQKAKAEEEGEEPPEAAPVCSIQDLLADQRLFRAAGIGFSQQELYLL